MCDLLVRWMVTEDGVRTATVCKFVNCHSGSRIQLLVHDKSFSHKQHACTCSCCNWSVILRDDELFATSQNKECWMVYMHDVTGMYCMLWSPSERASTYLWTWRVDNCHSLIVWTVLHCSVRKCNSPRPVCSIYRSRMEFRNVHQIFLVEVAI